MGVRYAVVTARPAEIVVSGAERVGDDRGSISTTGHPRTPCSASGTMQNIEALTAKYKALVSDICLSSMRVQTVFR